MKSIIFAGLLLLAGFSVFAQLQIDNQLQMTGASEATRRITNLGAPAAVNDATNVASIQGGSLTFATATGSGGNYQIVLTPAPAAYTAGMIINFRADHANTGPASLRVGGLAVVGIKVGVTNDLSAGEIANNQMVSVIYDGTNFQLLSRGVAIPTLPPSGPAGGDLTGTYPNPDIASNAVTTAEIANATITADDLAGTGVSAGTYTSITVNAQGQVTGGTNPGFTTGSGAAGHVSYWTSATAQAHDSDGNFFWDATNNRLGVGVGTPDRRLHIAATPSGSYEAKIGTGTVAQNATLDVIANHDNIALQVWDDNNLTTPRFLVMRNGNVGIANTAPGSTLQVGQNTASNNSDYGISILRHGTTTTPGTYTNSSPALNITDISGDGAASVDGQGLLYVAAPRIADTDANANNALLVNVINDNGTGLAVTGKRNVGIGTNAPGYRLHVNAGAIGGTFGILPGYAGWGAYGTGDGGAAIYNDNNSYKRLMIVGNSSGGGDRQVGIWDDLTVYSDLNMNGGAITGTFGIVPKYAAWSAYGQGDGGAAIYNDNGSYRKLMIVGNNSAGGSRQVGIWDDLTVNGNATITALGGSGTRLVTANASGTLSTRATDARNVNSFQVTGMNPNSKYLTCVYGITNNRGNDGATLTAIGVRNCAGSTLASTPAASINWPDGHAPHSHCFIITAPSDGCVNGFTDNGNALYMSVVQLD